MEIHVPTSDLDVSLLTTVAPSKRFAIDAIVLGYKGNIHLESSIVAQVSFMKDDVGLISVGEHSNQLHRDAP
jgi:hypothetical protein